LKKKKKKKKKGGGGYVIECYTESRSCKLGNLVKDCCRIAKLLGPERDGDPTDTSSQYRILSLFSFPLMYNIMHKKFAYIMMNDDERDHTPPHTCPLL